MENIEGKKQNKIVKFSIILIILIVLIAIILFIIFSSNSGGVGTAGINKQEFEKIELGMTQFEVNSIIDEYDEWNDDAVYEKCCEEIEKCEDNHIYKYYGESGGYATITYEADYSKGESFVMPTVSKKDSVDL